MTSLKLSAVTNDPFVFSRLYIGSQQREGDLEEFFAHKNHILPLCQSLAVFD